MILGRKKEETDLLPRKRFELEVFGSRNFGTHEESGWSSRPNLSSARRERKEPVRSLDERSRLGAVRVPLCLAAGEVEVYSGGLGEMTPKVKTQISQISHNSGALASSRSAALPMKAYLEPIEEEDPILLWHLMHSTREFVDISLLASSAVTVSSWKERVKKLSRAISANAAVRYLSHQMSNKRRIVKLHQSPS